MKIVFAFSGQGSQTYHMAVALYQGHPTFRYWMVTLDRKVREWSGQAVLERLYSDRHQRPDVFDDIRLTHPAIFMVEYALAQTLLSQGVEPDGVIGASLGEFCAAAVAGLISLEDALESVVRQAEIYHRLCPPGGMLAILAPESLYHELPLLYENTEIASFNYPGNFVVSGPPAVLDHIGSYLTERGTTALRLPVRQAFHSALMEGAKSEVCQQTERIVSRSARLPVVSCTIGGLLDTVDREYFWDVVRKPIQVARTVASLEHADSHLYLDLGPSGTFANLVKYNSATRPPSRAVPLLTLFGRDLEALETALATVAELGEAREPSGALR